MKDHSDQQAEEIHERPVEPSVADELRAMMLKALELTVYTDLSGEHSVRIQTAIKAVLKERGEDYRL